MDANQVVIVLECAAAVFAIGMGAWGMFVFGRYVKWAVQLSQLAARVAEGPLASSVVALPVEPAGVFEHDVHELQLEAVH